MGGVRTIRDLNGVEAGLISGEMAFILPILREHRVTKTNPIPFPMIQGYKPQRVE